MDQKIIFIDLETSPLIAYSWGPKFETNLIKVIEQSKILSYSAKWFEGKHETKGLPDYKGYTAGVVDDSKIINDIWELLNEADIVVAQNGKSFDIKVMNTRFLANGLGVPAPYKVVDPKTEVKRYLRLPSNSLDDICDYYGIGRKMGHEGFGLWLKCIAGDPCAWKRMKAYNRHDVVLMEKLYLLVRPFMKTHPNMGILTEKTCCPKCGSSQLIKKGFYCNQTTTYQRVKCTKCGGWSRTTLNTREIKPLVSI